MKRAPKLVSCSILGVMLALLVTPSVSADVNDFVINRFDADYTLSADDQQGQLVVKEVIDVDFSDQNHGILRALPNRYKNHRSQLAIGDISVDGKKAQWTTYKSNGNVVLKIGDPNHTITGKHHYAINYTVQNVITFFEDHDELYWDINGDQWAQEAQEVSVAVHLPGGVESDGHVPVCYTGSFGSTKQSCDIAYNSFLNTIFAGTTAPLGGYETISIVVGFKKDYFEPSSWLETLSEYKGTIAVFLIPLLLLGGTAGRYWYKYGRDPKGRGVIVPEYEAPAGLKPIEVGTIIDFKTDNRDITATIVDLAIRGYVKIIETKQVRKLRKDITTYSLRLENTDFSSLQDFEATILKGMFTNQASGEEVDLAALKYKLSDTAAKLRRSLRESLVAREYLRKNPFSTTFRFVGTLALAFLVSVIIAVVSQDGYAIIGIVLGSALALLFIVLLPARTPKGVEAKEHILGLKHYLQVAEAERIKKLQSPDAPYAAKTKEPKKTVELFEKLLPFAMVLGVEQEWAKQFENIYRTPPDWYQGNWTTFNALYLTSALNSGVQSGINAAFSSPSSSSSSGFGGGGAGAGGGGGGGGGGGW